jgi:Man1-Src1p-C-terminal domain
VRQKLTTHKAATAQIPTLVNTTLDRLATQAALAAAGRVGEGFISVGQLRDDVLRSTLGKTERERMWQGVKAIVEQNSNVRAAEREGERTGEWSRVWEWIGPIDMVKGSGLEGRRSGGLIRDVEDDDIVNGMSNNAGKGKDAFESRKWDEGRPIY